ncbi:MAG: hypothetical protein IJ468_05885 [Lachnospiraceae bacterium]|nr:hypothetical protein [Lachnospiraceae bacterium]
MNWIVTGILIAAAAVIMCYAMTKAASRAEELGELFVQKEKEGKTERRIQKKS